VTLGGGHAGKLTLKLYETLTGIQYGRLPDPHGWVEFV
jgi:branched-chain amino acid aminotransferase